MQVAQLNLRHLRVFREVAHCRSVSRAAPAVHLSQPAITQAIARLEEQLGARLFDRRSDGMAPTAAGGLFLARVERALAQLRNGAREAQRLAARRQGSGGRAGGFAAFEALVTMAQLRALIAVSTAENFSLAARTLGVAQPSLHRAARDLERLSGLSLYVRTASGIALTGSAAALAQAARLAFAELERSGLVVRACDKGVDAVTARSGRRGPILCPRMYRMPGSAVFHSPCPPGNNRGADRYLCPPSRGVSELTAGRRSRID